MMNGEIPVPTHPPAPLSTDRIACPACGGETPLGESYCQRCGADLALAATRRRAQFRVPWLSALLLAAVVAASLAGWQRFRAVGPGTDLATTLRWMVRGDGERRPTLATLLRAFETARAVMRCCLDTGGPCSLEPSAWVEVAGYSNAAWRGFVPLVQWAAARTAITGRLAELLTVDGKDGWGTPWRASLAPLPRGTPPAGSYAGALGPGPPPPAGRELWRLVLLSAGADRRADTGDDIRFEAIFPAPRPIRLGDVTSAQERARELERGQVWVSWQGTDLDLVDGRILAEFYLEARNPD
jgi:hypothetical protein